jgi:hypothetical protein
MNSDPHETAAWRTFGMLDSDEAAGFDEAMRQDPELRDAYWEMNLLSATVAAASVAPLAPRVGQLERLQARLGLQSSKSLNWLGISGWAAAAAALTFILVVDHQSTMPTESVKNSAAPHATKREVHVIQKATVEELAAQASPEEGSETAQTPSAGVSTANTSVASQASDVKLITKVETKRLVQEIAVLREKLESAEKREQQRMEPVQGMAWPMVMTMRPPRATSQITPTADTDTSVVGVLGDALAGRSSLADNRAAQASADLPSAVPIYDPATGAGTLVANNLSDTNLWVTARGESQARLLGKIPQSSEAYESVGFELPAGTIPANFIITNDSAGKSAPPSDKNTILIGPQ